MASVGALILQSLLTSRTGIRGVPLRPRKLADGEVIDLGGKRVRHIDTPHVPHNWEARVLFEETTKTLFCGDLFAHTGDGPALADAYESMIKQG